MNEAAEKSALERVRERDPILADAIEQMVMAVSGSHPTLTLKRNDVKSVLAEIGESTYRRERDTKLGLVYDELHDTIEIAGTKFAVVMLSNFKTSSGEDECYHHVRDGETVTISREMGHRTMIRRLREVALDAPCKCVRLIATTSSPDPTRRCERCEALAQTPDSIAGEAMGIQALVETARAFRATTKGDSNAPGWKEAQLESVGRVFGALEMLDMIYGQQRKEPGLIVKPGEGPA
jgi:hypothetical protein